MISEEEIKKIKWCFPWKPINDPRFHIETGRTIADPWDTPLISSSLEDELKRELCSWHPLFNYEVKAIAFSTEDMNEFIFFTSNPKMPLAFVHLTWRVEKDPKWPYTE